MTRVCVCSDRIGAASPADAGAALGRAFVGRDGAQVAVVPMAGGGADLVDALGRLGSPAERVSARTPRALGAALAEALVRRPYRLLVDLTDLADAGPSAAEDLLAGLAGEAEPVATVAALRETIKGIDLIGVLPHAQSGDVLLGLEGVAARAGFAAGTPRAEVLALDARLARLASELGVRDAPGVGAAGGAPLAVLALGGRLATGFELCRAAASLDATLARADLLVVGTDSFTTGDFGGPLALGLAPLASDLGLACVAVARVVEIGPRELRRHGVEQVHALGGGPGLTPQEITEAATGVARTWLR